MKSLSTKFTRHWIDTRWYRSNIRSVPKKYQKP